MCWNGFGVRMLSSVWWCWSLPCLVGMSGIHSSKPVGGTNVLLPLQNDYFRSIKSTITFRVVKVFRVVCEKNSVTKKYSIGCSMIETCCIQSSGFCCSVSSPLKSCYLPRYSICSHDRLLPLGLWVRAVYMCSYWRTSSSLSYDKGVLFRQI